MSLLMFHSDKVTWNEKYPPVDTEIICCIQQDVGQISDLQKLVGNAE